VNIVELEWMKKSTTKQADLLIGILLTIRGIEMNYINQDKRYMTDEERIRYLEESIRELRKEKENLKKEK
jgi:hypothetical protein